MDHHDPWPGALERHDARTHQATAVDTDVVRTESRAHPHHVEDFGVEPRDFHEQLATGGIPIEREEAVEFSHRRRALFDGAQGLRSTATPLLGDNWRREQDDETAGRGEASRMDGAK